MSTFKKDLKFKDLSYGFLSCPPAKAAVTEVSTNTTQVHTSPFWELARL